MKTNLPVLKKLQLLCWALVLSATVYAGHAPDRTTNRNKAGNKVSLVNSSIADKEVILQLIVPWGNDCNVNLKFNVDIDPTKITGAYLKYEDTIMNLNGRFGATSSGNPDEAYINLGSYPMGKCTLILPAGSVKSNADATVVNDSIGFRLDMQSVDSYMSITNTRQQVVTANSFKISWDYEGGHEIAKYIAYYSLKPIFGQFLAFPEYDNATKVDNISGEVLTYTFTDVPSAEAYHWALRAVTADGWLLPAAYNDGMAPVRFGLKIDKSSIRNKDIVRVLSDVPGDDQLKVYIKLDGKIKLSASGPFKLNTFDISKDNVSYVLDMMGEPVRDEIVIAINENLIMSDVGNNLLIFPQGSLKDEGNFGNLKADTIDFKAVAKTFSAVNVAMTLYKFDSVTTTFPLNATLQEAVYYAATEEPFDLSMDPYLHMDVVPTTFAFEKIDVLESKDTTFVKRELKTKTKYYSYAIPYLKDGYHYSISSAGFAEVETDAVPLVIKQTNVADSSVLLYGSDNMVRFVVAFDKEVDLTVAPIVKVDGVALPATSILYNRVWNDVSGDFYPLEEQKKAKEIQMLIPASVDGKEIVVELPQGAFTDTDGKAFAGPKTFRLKTVAQASWTKYLKAPGNIDKQSMEVQWDALPSAAYKTLIYYTEQRDYTLPKVYEDFLNYSVLTKKTPAAGAVKQELTSYEVERARFSYALVVIDDKGFKFPMEWRQDMTYGAPGVNAFFPKAGVFVDGSSDMLKKGGGEIKMFLNENVTLKNAAQIQLVESKVQMVNMNGQEMLMPVPEDTLDLVVTVDKNVLTLTYPALKYDKVYAVLFPKGSVTGDHYDNDDYIKDPMWAGTGMFPLEFPTYHGVSDAPIYLKNNPENQLKVTINGSKIALVFDRDVEADRSKTITIGGVPLSWDAVSFGTAREAIVSDETYEVVDSTDVPAVWLNFAMGFSEDLLIKVPAATFNVKGSESDSAFLDVIEFTASSVFGDESPMTALTPEAKAATQVTGRSFTANWAQLHDWEATDTTVEEMMLYYSTEPNFLYLKDLKSVKVANTDSSVVVSKLKLNTKYYYVLRGVQYKTGDSSANFYSTKFSAIDSVLTTADAFMALEDVIEEDEEGVALQLSEVVITEGIVTTPVMDPGSSGTLRAFCIQDGTKAGINVRLGVDSVVYTVKMGDKIRVSGVVEQYSGLIQLNKITKVEVKASNQTVPAAQEVTSMDNSVKSELIRYNGMRYLDTASRDEWPADQATLASGKTFKFTNGVDTIDVRLSRGFIIAGMLEPAPTDTFDITGVCGQFVSKAPFTSGYQLLPRTQADFVGVGGPTAIRPSTALQYRVYPNPAKDFITVECDERIEQIDIVDMNGRVMMSKVRPDNKQVLDVRQLPSGFFFVRVRTATEISVSKLVK